MVYLLLRDKNIGIYNMLINRDRDGFRFDLVNYYRDITIFEQLYLKNQELELTTLEVMGVSTDINLMDFNSLTEVVPLIINFEDIYELEIAAIEELQEEIGTGFDIEEESEDEAGLE